MVYFSSPKELTLYEFGDANWVSNPDDSKSMSSYCVFFGGNIASWGSKKQSAISRSSIEAEYHCLALVATVLVCLHSPFTDLHIILTKRPKCSAPQCQSHFTFKNQARGAA